jgi:teichuronic acid biosynthesis glycosyltransferase TuaG
LTDFEKRPCPKNPNILGNFDHTTNSLVGGLWGGRSKVCLEWNKIYHSTLKKYFDSNIFAGKDQLVMMTAILENPHIATVIMPTDSYVFDRWFFLQHVLLRSEKYQIDTSYPKLPTIAIMIPLYNGIEFLSESTESIKNQTYTNWKCFIGVNGHGDNTTHICDKIRSQLDSRFIVVPQNSDINNKSKSLNNLVSVIPEEYNILCLLDVDDKWLPEKLEKQITKISDYEIIGTECRYFGDSDIKPQIQVGEIPRKAFLECNHMINSSFMILRKHAHWDEKLFSIEDYDLWLRKDIEGVKFYNIPEILVLHRCHKSSYFNSKHISDKDLVDKYRNLYKS